jgi:hypothetical protein
MKRFKLSLQVIVALLAITATLAAKNKSFSHTVLRTTQDCYIDPTGAVVGTCVLPAILTNTDRCTEPPVAYCCYTFTICPTSSTKVLVDQIILYRGI